MRALAGKIYAVNPEGVIDKQTGAECNNDISDSEFPVSHSKFVHQHVRVRKYDHQ